MSITILFSHFCVYNRGLRLIILHIETRFIDNVTGGWLCLPGTCAPGIPTSVGSALPLALNTWDYTWVPNTCVVPVSWNRLSKWATQQSSLVDSQTGDLSHPRIHLPTSHLALGMLELFRPYYDCILSHFWGFELRLFISTAQSCVQGEKTNSNQNKSQPIKSYY